MRSIGSSPRTHAACEGVERRLAKPGHLYWLSASLQFARRLDFCGLHVGVCRIELAMSRCVLVLACSGLFACDGELLVAEHAAEAAAAIPAPSLAITPLYVNDEVTGTVTIETTTTRRRTLRIAIDGVVVASRTNVKRLQYAWDTTAVTEGPHLIEARVVDGRRSAVTSRQVVVRRTCASAPLRTSAFAAAVGHPLRFVLDEAGVSHHMTAVPAGTTVTTRNDAWELTTTELGARAPSAPVAVPLSGGWAMFVTAENGQLYKNLVDSHGTNPATATSVDLKRGLGCTPDDALRAAPAVQLRAYSTATYTRSDDLVFVITDHGCGDHSQNQVIALSANTLAEASRFNEYGQFQVDGSVAGCVLDYPASRLYCATKQQPGMPQNTIWAIDTNNGNLVWARDVGSVLSRPSLNPVTRRLMVANAEGILYAIAVDTPEGSVAWSFPLVGPGDSIVRPIWAEFRGPYADMVFATTVSGAVIATYDAGTEGIVLWSADPPGTTSFTSAPALVPDIDRLYVGTNEGTLWELAPATGGQTGVRAIASSPAPGRTVMDPVVDYAAGRVLPYSVVAVEGSTVDGRLVELCIPFGPPSN